MKRIFLSVMFALVFLQVYAQVRRRSPNLAFGVQVVQPVGQFAEIYDGYPAGLAGNFTAPLSNTPFEVGAGFAWNSMGSQDEDISVLVGEDINGDKIYEMGTMRIRSNNYRYQAIARFRPFVGQVQIYGDAIAGMESFSTKTDIEIDNSGYTEVSDSEVQQRDHAINFGWAAGLRVQVATGVYIDARFEKIEGGLARYVDSETIVVDQETNDIEFEVRESQTDKFTYQLGIAFQF